MKRRYATAAALRAALEGRLGAMAKEQGLDLQRLRRQVAFDRLLCRLFRHTDSPWVLKGGYAMELRIQSARTTRDIDLAVRTLPEGAKDWNAVEMRELLTRASDVDFGDGFAFLIGEPTLDLDAAPYGGSRFPIDARMAGRRFVSFHLDVSAGDVLREPFELLEGYDWLGFAGIAKARVPAISREEQFAEKLHAYTLPRMGRPNTRVKDLVDMLLLQDSGTIDESMLAENIKGTFRRRRTHEVPATLPPPLSGWEVPFGELASACGLDKNIVEQYRRLASFLAGILR